MELFTTVKGFMLEVRTLLQISKYRYRQTLQLIPQKSYLYFSPEVNYNNVGDKDKSHKKS
jgi:hypothetical protein